MLNVATNEFQFQCISINDYKRCQKSKNIFNLNIIIIDVSSSNEQKLINFRCNLYAYTITKTEEYKAISFSV